MLLKDNSLGKSVDLRSFLLSCCSIALTCSVRHAIQAFTYYVSIMRILRHRGTRIRKTDFVPNAAPVKKGEICSHNKSITRTIHFDVFGVTF